MNGLVLFKWMHFSIGWHPYRPIRIWLLPGAGEGFPCLVTFKTEQPKRYISESLSFPATVIRT
jgi:hypothetical protein